MGDTYALDAANANLGFGYSKACFADKTIFALLNTLLYKNSKNTGLNDQFKVIWKAIGAGFNAGANSAAKATFGLFLGGAIDTGFKFGAAPKAKASGATGVKIGVKIGGKTATAADAKASAGAKTSGSISVKPKIGVKVSGGASGSAGAKASGSAKGGAKVGVKIGTKRRQLQAVQPTSIAYTTSDTGLDILSETYKSGLAIPTDLTHDGMIAVASANLLKTMIAPLAVFYALF